MAAQQARLCLPRHAHMHTHTSTHKHTHAHTISAHPAIPASARAPPRPDYHPAVHPTPSGRPYFAKPRTDARAYYRDWPEPPLLHRDMRPRLHEWGLHLCAINEAAALPDAAPVAAYWLISLGQGFRPPWPGPALPSVGKTSLIPRVGEIPSRRRCNCRTALIRAKLDTMAA
jgi:hypothetical protein